MTLRHFACRACGYGSNRYYIMWTCPRCKGVDIAEGPPRPQQPRQPKQLTAVRLSDESRRKLADLSDRYGTITSALEVAIDRLHTSFAER